MDVKTSVFCVSAFGMQVYVAEVTADVAICAKRNTHRLKQPELQKVSHFSLHIAGDGSVLF